MKALQLLASQYDELITLEEHQLSGGFGSAILEALNNMLQEGLIRSIPKIKRIGIPDEFISIAGSQEFIRTKAGLVL